ncbi:MAG: MFS transporter [Frankiaceae bacterium]|nr:MFS transporter [Frankiaceae bacterium]MBV9869455.1 MFS transporter [Frankiaceae bacterium]
MSDLTPEAALDDHFRRAVAGLESGAAKDAELPVREGSRLTGAMALALYEAQVGNRALDIEARRLRAAGRGFYTIGSSGHESNAAVAAAVRPTDPALLHYRSGAFYLARAAHVPGSTPIRDVLLGLIASTEEPIAGGRHKVFGHRDLAVIPQTSTIASHLPRAVGVGFAIDRGRKLGIATTWPSDAIAVCSFGDASANHSTAVGAINAASNIAYRGLPMPVLFVCEDNGIGISVPTPAGWVAAAYGDRPGLRYFAADGEDLPATYDAAREAAEHVRSTRSPAFLHLRVVRFMAHAGTDAEITYRRPSEIAADYDRDPVLATARLLVSTGVITPEQALARYDAATQAVQAESKASVGHRQLASAEEIVAPLSPRHPVRVADAAARSGSDADRRAAFAGKLPEAGERLTLADSINRALTDALVTYPHALAFGEDVGRKGGVYGVTRGLARRFGAGRVFDTLLDEQTILGLGLGAAVSGLLPIPEIQYLAYLHNAEDQLRGEAASLQFFSNGQYRNPMVVRIAGLAYQKGFGGHFHNDNGVSVLRDIPGLVVAVPSRGDDAAAMLRTCLAAALVDGTVSVFLEPIALYHSRDLHEPGDDAWLSAYTGPEGWAAHHIPIGRARCHGGGHDVTMVTFGNGVPMSLRVSRRLSEAGVASRILDLRWLAPLPVDDLMTHASATGRVLVVDETRSSGGISEAVITTLVDRGFGGRIARIAATDSFIPLGDAANHVLVSETAIEKAAHELLSR